MSESEGFRWADSVAVRSHFQRSANIQHDFAAKGWLNGYIVTPLARSIARRVATGLSPDGHCRAWSVIGPYGTGKSAFGLFLSHLIGTPKMGQPRVAKSLLKEADPAIYETLFGKGGALRGFGGLCPVHATGESNSLEAVLLGALLRSMGQFWSGPGRSPRDLVVRIEDAKATADEGSPVSAQEVVGLFEEAAEAVAKSKNDGSGLLIILDEAGKVLEYAARGRSNGDVYLLQVLAESASRSDGADMVLVVMLHQGFEHYASRLSVAQRNEWAKIQGRFVDIPFMESPAQTLRLIGAALDTKGPLLGEESIHNLSKAVAGEINEKGLGQADLTAMLNSCAPLHPLTALALGPLFRSKLAQNERSLFAFLIGAEPHGFQQFLLEPGQVKKPRLFSLDRLYDYAIAAFGGRLYAHQGHQWAQIETAIRRLPPDAEAADARILKVLGLLEMLGDEMGVKPSDVVLDMAFENTELKPNQVHDALERLQASSVVIYRKYRSAYQLWEGSDLNLETLIEEARNAVEPGQSFAKRLTRIAPPRPVVARRHLFETGTFRYFEVRYGDESLISGTDEIEETTADGLLYLIIPTCDEIGEILEKELNQEMTHWRFGQGARPCLLGLPTRAPRIRDLAIEILALEYVHANTPALLDDRVARRELAGRRAEAERLLREELASCLSEGLECKWFYREEQFTFDGPGQLSRKVSTICSEVYYEAPVILNELVNRSQLSTSAAAARRGMMQAMITKGDQERLGFEGNPPELAIYRSILEQHGIHKTRKGEFVFNAPKKEQGSLRPAWDKVCSAIKRSGEERTSLEEIYGELRQPPLGMKDGVIPILFLAALIKDQDDVALYEDDAFVASISEATIERILRAPRKFQIQAYKIQGPRAKVFDSLQALLTVDQAKKTKATVVTIVRALVRFVRDLPDYSRATRSIDAEAIAVRDALVRARDPGTLLFKSLPAALHVPELKASGGLSSGEAASYVMSLRSALRGLQGAYPALLERLSQLIGEVFGVEGGCAGQREKIAVRAERANSIAVETNLRGFLGRVADNELKEDEWITSIGTLIGGKPPRSWLDQDLQEVELNLAVLARRLRTTESMLFDGAGQEAEGLVRLSVAQVGEAERDIVVPLGATPTRATQLARELRALLDSVGEAYTLEEKIAGLALACKQVIPTVDEGVKQKTTG